jgi:anti-anti-sigma factor
MMISPTPARPAQKRVAKRVADTMPGSAVSSRDEFSVSRDELSTIIAIHVELDYGNVKNLDKAIVRAAASSDGVVVDLLGCALCDSASLAALAKQKYVLKERLQFVVGERGSVRRALEVTGLSVNLGISPNVPAALAKLRSAI